jgi:hypothetical protein
LTGYRLLSDIRCVKPHRADFFSPGLHVGVRLFSPGFHIGVHSCHEIFFAGFSNGVNLFLVFLSFDLFLRLVCVHFYHSVFEQFFHLVRVATL